MGHMHLLPFTVGGRSAGGGPDALPPLVMTRLLIISRTVVFSKSSIVRWFKMSKCSKFLFPIYLFMHLYESFAEASIKLTNVVGIFISTLTADSLIEVPFLRLLQFSVPNRFRCIPHRHTLRRYCWSDKAVQNIDPPQHSPLTLHSAWHSTVHVKQIPFKRQ